MEWLARLLHPVQERKQEDKVMDVAKLAGCVIRDRGVLRRAPPRS